MRGPHTALHVLRLKCEFVQLLSQTRVRADSLRLGACSPQEPRRSLASEIGARLQCAFRASQLNPAIVYSVLSKSTFLYPIVHSNSKQRHPVHSETTASIHSSIGGEDSIHDVQAAASYCPIRAGIQVHSIEGTSLFYEKHRLD